MNTNWVFNARVHETCQLAPTGIPERYQGLRFEGILHPTISGATKDYLLQFWDLAARGLAPAFLGQAGTYKTFAAAHIAERINLSGLLDVAWVQVGVEFPKLEQERFNPLTTKRQRYLERVPFLVLDDFTKLKPGSIASDMLDALVEARYSNRHPTLYTGNIVITAEDSLPLVMLFNAGFARRFRETSQGLVVVTGQE